MWVKIVVWGIKYYLKRKLSKAVYDKVVDAIDSYLKK